MFISYHTTGAPGSDLTDTMHEDMSTKKAQLSTASSTEAQHLPKSDKSQGTVVPCIGLHSPRTLENSVLTSNYF